MQRVAETLRQQDLRARLAENIRWARERAGLSQEQLAEQMREVAGYGWHQQTVARTETGTRPVRADEMVALSDVLNVSLVVLMRSPGAAQRLRLDRAVQAVAAAQAHIADGHDQLAAAAAALASAITDADAEGVDTEDARRALAAATEEQ